MDEPGLFGDGRTFFDSREHKLYKRFLDGAGHIQHGPWLRAMAEGAHVGTCRRCGDWLIPQRPREVSASRTDYQADCRDEGCGWVCVIPGGRYLVGSTRLSERKTTP
jgi:hypothetical protein